MNCVLVGQGADSGNPEGVLDLDSDFARSVVICVISFFTEYKD